VYLCGELNDKTMQHVNIRKFNRMCEKPDYTRNTADLVLAYLMLQKGEDETVRNYKWYAQITSCIVSGDIASVTEEEKIAFIELHTKLVSEIKKVL
jgi:hypothetical protein